MRVAWLSLSLLVVPACADPKEDPPEIARITPAAACGEGVVTLLLEGNHFDPEVGIDFPVKNTNSGIFVAPEDRAVLTPRRAIVLHDQTRGAPAAGEPPIVHDVRMVNPDGQEGRLLAGFTTYSTFTFNGVMPNRGPAGNTVALVISGSGLYGPMTLEIGANAVVTVDDIRPASPVSATTPLEIPPGTRPGSYPLILRNPGGCAVALDRAFTVE